MLRVGSGITSVRSVGFRRALGIQVYKHHLNWALKSVNVGYWIRRAEFRVQGLGFRSLCVAFDVQGVEFVQGRGLGPKVSSPNPKPRTLMPEPALVLKVLVKEGPLEIHFLLDPPPTLY